MAKILVIDDQVRNQASARLLEDEGHEVTILTSIQQVWDLLGPNLSGDCRSDWAEFDLVMTDLFLPVDTFTGSMNPAFGVPTGELPAGLVFAIAASNRGVPVIIFTDSDHHRDWVCTLLDFLFTKPQKDGLVQTVETRGACIGGHWDESQGIVMDDQWWRKNLPRIKDWVKALKRTAYRSERFKFD